MPSVAWNGMIPATRCTVNIVFCTHVCTDVEVDMSSTTRHREQVLVNGYCALQINQHRDNKCPEGCHIPEPELYFVHLEQLHLKRKHKIPGVANEAIGALLSRCFGVYEK